MTNQTGPWPAFYKLENIQMQKAADKKRESSQTASIKITRNLKAKYIIPYASDICYFNEDFYANYFHYDDKEKYREKALKEIPLSEVIIMNPHSKIKFKDGEIIERDLKTYESNLGKEYIKNKDEIDKINKARMIDNINDISKLSNIFYQALYNMNNNWRSGKFKVLWQIENLASQKKYIVQIPGESVNILKKPIIDNFDLIIYLDL